MALFEAGEVLDLAIAMEILGREFYESLAAGAVDEELRGLFNMLAIEEKVHQETFEGMKAREGVIKRDPGVDAERYYQALRDLERSMVFRADQQTVRMLKSIREVDHALEVAIQLEEDSIRYYQEMLPLVVPEHHKVVDAIISEERFHLQRLSEMALRLVPRIRGLKKAPPGPAASVESMLDSDGFLQDFDLWNEDAARGIAIREGIETLTEEHFRVLLFVREYYRSHRMPPLPRTICEKLALDKTALYRMFQKDPVKVIKIAGLPRPSDDQLAHIKISDC